MMDLEEAIDVVARAVIFDRSMGVAGDWDNYPLVGESDWEAVLDRVDVLAYDNRPTTESYEEGYALLAEKSRLWDLENR